MGLGRNRGSRWKAHLWDSSNVPQVFFYTLGRADGVP
jgi:hypothetical protein